MASIKLKFRVPSINNEVGSLYYQVIHKRSARQIATEYKIYSWEWNIKEDGLVRFNNNYFRFYIISIISDNIKYEMERLNFIIKTKDTSGKPYTPDDVASSFIEIMSNEMTLFDYSLKYINKLQMLNRFSTADHVIAMLGSFKKFRCEMDLKLSMLNVEIIEQYEAFLKGRGNSRNTTSFYIRTLRSVYNQSIDDDILVDSKENIFRRVYTGIDKTIKRAITLKEIKRIQFLDLSEKPTLRFARDIFMFSIYTQGMSFIDIAYLRKRDLSNGEISYRRHKTGQTLNITWENVMQKIVEQHPSCTQYLLPIITVEDGSERNQYKNAMMLINRKLKEIAKLANILHPISLYTARHSWATAARDKNIPLYIISEGLGHNSEINTQIYLSSIKTSEVRKANRKIIQDIITD